MKFEFISIELSNQCNLKCPLCARKDYKEKRLFLIKPDEFENIRLNEVKSLRQIQLAGSIGEPITNPYFVDIVKIIKKWDKRVLVSTNGSFRNEDWWYNLPKYLPEDHSVRFAIDGVDNETLNIYRKGASYDKILRNASAFIKGGGNAVWQMILFEHNEHQCNDVQKKSDEIGFESCIFIPSIYYNDEYKRPKSLISDSEYSESKKKTHKKCRIELGKAIVSSKGEYLPCCFCYDDNVVHEISNEPIKYIRDYSFLELIESGYYDRIIDRILTTKIEICSSCIAYCGQRIYKIEDL